MKKWIAILAFLALAGTAIAVSPVENARNISKLDARTTAAETAIDALEAGTGLTAVPTTVLTGSLTTNQLSNAWLKVTGDITIDRAGVAALANDTVAAAEMADADHGDVTWTSGVAAIDDGAVLESELTYLATMMSRPLVDGQVITNGDYMVQALTGPVAVAITNTILAPGAGSVIGRPVTLFNDSTNCSIVISAGSTLLAKDASIALSNMYNSITITKYDNDHWLLINAYTP